MADDGTRVIENFSLKMVSQSYNVPMQKRIFGCV